LKMKKLSRNKIILIIAGAIVLLALVILLLPKKGAKITATYIPHMGTIKISVSTTGDVQPQNRLEIKPPLAGRVEKILVVEGQNVKLGQTLAYMSSSDRAAIIDAARAQGEKNLKQWEDIYKLIPLVAPINGEVIVQSVQPGQSVAMSDDIVVLSDRLIVQAQVDETDIGKIKLGQETNITLDAYPNKIISGKVDHIYYESKTVNNVTIYDVDILPDSVPDFFRSGMSANIDIVEDEKDNVVLLPLDAVKKIKDKNVVFVKPEKGGKNERREVVTGLADDDNVEIVSGLAVTETVVTEKLNYVAQQKSSAVNPFMPGRPAGAGRSGR
jgi:macrolide-specific efflux system membrane fusion protein